MAKMAFISSPLDRQANARADAAWILARRNSKQVKILQLSGDGVRMRENALVTAPQGHEGEMVFLGDDKAGHAWFAVSRHTEGEMSPLRPLMVSQQLPEEELSIVAQARSLVHWHERHGFCAQCGHRTEMADAGYRRHCSSCKTDHFPRTDPVVIMAAQHGENILLGRQKAWEPGMYSAIAGFMEPGETIEQAVAREVREETGVVIGAVRYIASQPWPFPASLMIGCVAETLDAKITLDEKELEHARWFSKAEVRLMLDHKHPDGLHASHPWAIAHAVISAALQ